MKQPLTIATPLLLLLLALAATAAPGGLHVLAAEGPSPSDSLSAENRSQAPSASGSEFTGAAETSIPEAGPGVHAAPESAGCGLLGTDFSEAPQPASPTTTEQMAALAPNSLGSAWHLDSDGFVRERYRSFWTRLRDEHHLRGFVQLGIGSNHAWETRIGVGMDLVPGRLRLGLEAARRDWNPD